MAVGSHEQSPQQQHRFNPPYRIENPSQLWQIVQGPEKQKEVFSDGNVVKTIRLKKRPDGSMLMEAQLSDLLFGGESSYESVVKSIIAEGKEQPFEKVLRAHVSGDLRLGFTTIHRVTDIVNGQEILGPEVAKLPTEATDWNVFQYMISPNDLKNQEAFIDQIAEGMEILSTFIQYAAKVQGYRVPTEIISLSDGGEKKKKTADGKPTDENEKKKAKLWADIVVNRFEGCSFDDIIGQEQAVEEARILALQLANPNKFSASLPTGYLLHGEPGNGKTQLAKAIAADAKAGFLHVKANHVVGSGNYGQAEQQMGEVFDIARQLASEKGACIVFFDEIHAIFPKQSAVTYDDTTERVISIGLSEMEGFDKNPGVIVLGATNKPEMINVAIRSRFEYDITMHNPTPENAAKICMHHARKILGERKTGNIHEEKLAQALKDARLQVSGRDIEKTLKALSRTQEAEKLRRGTSTTLTTEAIVESLRLRLSDREDDEDNSYKGTNMGFGRRN